MTQEEAVMKRLTAEELAELRYFHAPKGEYVPATSLKKDTLHSLLAMASRLVDVESEWFEPSERPPLFGDSCWVQFDDLSIGTKVHVYTGEPLSPWRVNGNIQHAPVIAYCLAKPPTSPTQKQGDR